MKKYHSKIVGDDGETYAEIWWDPQEKKVVITDEDLIHTLFHVKGIDHKSENFPKLLPHIAKPHSWFHLHTVTKDDWKNEGV